MADLTHISWCDSTHNPVIGCTKVAPACDHCYAERDMATRLGRVEWGPSKPRLRTSEENRRQPLLWNARPFYECLDCGARFAAAARKAGFVCCPRCSKTGKTITKDEALAAPVKAVRRRVFACSLADWLDNEWPIEWFVDFLDVIRRTPNLDWLLLSKRIGNWRARLEAAGNTAIEQKRDDLADWIVAWLDGRSVPAHVWLGATIENQKRANEDVTKLLSVHARVRFVSIEPMLGAINLRALDRGGGITLDALTGYFSAAVHFDGGIQDAQAHLQQLPQLPSPLPSLDWVIAGGESGPKARPTHPAWVRSLRDQCQAPIAVPFHFKQWGEWAPDTHFIRMPEKDEHIQEWLGSDGVTVEAHSWKYNKRDNGRLLDGRTWDEFPGLEHPDAEAAA